MAVANFDLAKFPQNGLTKKYTLNMRWNKYLKHFNALCKAIGVTNCIQKQERYE